jgi:hypothetical protein
MVFFKTLTKYFGNVGIMHVRTSFQNLPPFILGPHHESVHWPFYVGLVLAFPLLLPDYLG